MAALLEIDGLSKHFGDFTALHELSLAVERGSVLALLGPSGGGKSTLLRCVAGLERPDTGEIRFEGQRINDQPVHQRGFGLMFQDFALFPHRSVAQNVAFGLRMAGQDRAAIQDRVAEMLELVGLSGYDDRSPLDLSGGERQRVALARSLAPSPHLLMLDEPLGSLDRGLRERLMGDLRHILTQVGITALYVTHDQQEAFSLSDRVLLLNQGHIEQQGTPEQIYRRPATPFAARFFGLTNLIKGATTETRAKQIIVQTEIGPLCVDWPDGVEAPRGVVTVVIRPEAARLASEADEDCNHVRGEVVERTFRGAAYDVLLKVNDLTLSFEISSASSHLPQVGEAIGLSLHADALWIIE
ncbi:MAG: ABC transporter ATP-binding protein [Chloroflexi bacterium]|nr:ABC transporter ATP-binding protein [Chloroflexota bacterium]